MAEMDSMRRLLNEIKASAEHAQNKIQEYVIKESIAIEDMKVQKVAFQKKIKQMSANYIEIIKSRDEVFKQYREFVLFEIETHENVREKLEGLIKLKQSQIEELRETLKVPRSHFKNIERLTVEEIIIQKNQILEQISKETGVPLENILEKLYEKTARKQAKKQLDKELKEKEEGSGEENQTEEANSPTKSPAKSKKTSGLGDYKSSPRLQREMSNKSLLSKANTEADSTMQENNLMRSRFSFGVQ